MKGVWSEFAEEGLKNVSQLEDQLDVDVVEIIARMTQEERNAFTQKFADRWPELAETISSCLYNEVMVKRGEI